MSTNTKELFGLETFCGIELFKWTGWDEIDLSLLQFYEVEFIPESMKKYNGCTVALDRDGQLEIYGKNEDSVVYSAYITDIPEVLDALINMKGKTNNDI